MSFQWFRPMEYRTVPEKAIGDDLQCFIVEPHHNGHRFFLSKEGVWSRRGRFYPGGKGAGCGHICRKVPTNVVLDGELVPIGGKSSPSRVTALRKSDPSKLKFVAYDCLMSLDGQLVLDHTWGMRAGHLREALMESADPRPPASRSISRRRYAPHVSWEDPSPTYQGMLCGIRGVLEQGHARAGSGWRTLLEEVKQGGGGGIILKRGGGYKPGSRAFWLRIKSEV